MLLETDRLIIRPFAKSDLADFTKLLDIPEVIGWQMQKSNAEVFLDWHISNYAKMDIVHGVVCFGIFEKESGHIIGAAGAGRHDDLHEPEIFYSVLPDERGKGYAVESARAVTEWALSDYPIPYLIGTVEVGNAASQKVLEHCGYEYVNEQTLLVHVENKRHKFKYYRRYKAVNSG